MTICSDGTGRDTKKRMTSGHPLFLSDQPMASPLEIYLDFSLGLGMIQFFNRTVHHAAGL